MTQVREAFEGLAGAVSRGGGRTASEGAGLASASAGGASSLVAGLRLFLRGVVGPWVAGQSGAVGGVGVDELLVRLHAGEVALGGR